MMRTRVVMLAAALLLAPQVARADYMDVITTRLGECSLDKYIGIVEEFRGVMKQQKYSYSVEITVPLMSEALDVVFWVGRSPSLTAFGEGFTRWQGEIAKPSTPEAKVSEKLNACGENVSRSGFLTR